MTKYPNNEQRGDQHVDRQPDLPCGLPRAGRWCRCGRRWPCECGAGVLADAPKVCPVCEDSACETKSMKCGRG